VITGYGMRPVVQSTAGRWVMSSATHVSGVSGGLWSPRWPRGNRSGTSGQGRRVSAVSLYPVTSGLQTGLQRAPLRVTPESGQPSSFRREISRVGTRRASVLRLPALSALGVLGVQVLPVDDFVVAGFIEVPDVGLFVVAESGVERSLAREIRHSRCLYQQHTTWRGVEVPYPIAAGNRPGRAVLSRAALAPSR
jgi:hypothetical protein